MPSSPLWQLRALLGAAMKSGGGGLKELEIRAEPHVLLDVSVFATPGLNALAAACHASRCGSVFHGFDHLEKLTVVGQPPGLDLLAELLTAPLPELRHLSIGMPAGVTDKMLRPLYNRFPPAGVSISVLEES